MPQKARSTKKSGNLRRSHHLRAEPFRHNAFNRRLRCEPLEERRLLSVQTVINLTDAIDENTYQPVEGSLRWAIEEANDGDGDAVVLFADGLTGTITLTEGELNIECPLTITGPGASVLTIDGDDLSQIFYIDDYNSSNNIDVEITGLTLTGGNASNGGAIASFENLTLRESVVTGNWAENDGGGLWVYGAYGASITIENTTISNNTASGDGGGIRALTKDAMTTIRDTVISGNTADTNGGGVWAFTTAGGSTLIQNCTISGANNAGYDGGGIWARSSEGSTTIENTAVRDSVAYGRGGGIWAESQDGSMTVRDTTLSGNTAYDCGGGILALAQYGGSTLIDRCTISDGNNADADGGGVWMQSFDAAVTIRNTTVSDNVANVNGGGISSNTLAGGITTIQNTTVSGNTALGVGGGLYACNYGTAKLQNSTITGNSSETAGGGLYSAYAIYSGYTAINPVVPVIVESVIIAKNTDSENAAPDIAGTLPAMVHSLIGDKLGSELTEAPIGSPDADGNLIGDSEGGGVIDPLLGELADNGGPTLTCALLAGSPAIGLGSNSGSLATDQRGGDYARQRASGAVDIGAYQVSAAELVVLDATTEIVNGQTAAIGVGAAAHGAPGPAKTFTIRNDGELAITLTTPFADATHFTLSDPGATVLAAGESTTFTVTLNTETAWAGSETVSFVSTDADGAITTFTFAVSGSVAGVSAEITVLDGETSIADGQTTPIDLGSAAHNAMTVSKTFTIRNDGDETLTLTVPFTSTSHFSVSSPAMTSLGANESTTFTVTLLTGAVWSGSETISFVNSDSDEGTFTFVVSGTVTALPAEISVFNGQTSVTDGQTAPIDFGVVLHSASGVSKTFTIRNDGDESLTLTVPFSSTSHFLVSSPGTTSLATGQSTTFTVTLLTGTVWSGSETISFVNSDADEGTFTFVVSGTVATAPADVTVLDGTTNVTCGQTTPIDLGTAIHGAAGVSKTFTIRNDGEETLILTAPFFDTPHFAVSDPAATSLAAGESTTFTVTLLTGTVWTGSETIAFATSDTDESYFTFVVSGTVTNVPAEISVFNGQTSVADGQTTPIDFGAVLHNASGVSKTFTIRNDGDETLTLTGPFTSTSHFSVSSPAVTSLGANESTTFTVTLVTGAVWSGSETISFVNSDSDEGTFTFVVSGTVTALPAEISVFNGQTPVTDGQTAPIDFGVVLHNASGVSKTFTIRNDGDESLTLTVPFSSTSHFLVSSPGTTSLAAGQSTTFTVTLLTGTVWSGSETISFVNSDSDEGTFTFVVSGTVATAPADVTVLDGTTNVTCGQTTPIDLGTVVHGAAGVSKTFTIRNDGEETLILTAPFFDTSHFAVSDPAATSLAAGESTTFTVTLLTGTVWSGSETIAFATSDTDESYFTFVVSGTVTGTLPEIVVLDGTTELVSGETTPIDFGAVVRTSTAVRKTFTIRNDGEQTLLLTVPFSSTSHFIVGQPGKSALAAGESTTFTVTLNTQTAWTGSETISFLNTDGDGGDGVESPFTFVVSATVTAIPAEITVLRGNTVVLNDQAIDLGMSVLDTTGRSVTFTIRNDGDETLELTTPFEDTLHFTVGQPGVSSLEAGESTTFTVTLKTNAVWTGSEEISFFSNDADESPFVITLSGLVSELAHDASTIGVYSASTSTFYLRNSNSTGYADFTFQFGQTGGGWETIVGDWDGDGVDTVGLYDPATSTFYLNDGNHTGYAGVAFVYGLGNRDWVPIAGDWNGDGIDTVGLYDPDTSTFYLKNTNSSGYADAAFRYGLGNRGWTPIVGDWDFDGADTVGLYDPTASVFYLRNQNFSGYADAAFAYGEAGRGWTPIAGDWDADGQCSVGLYSPTTASFYLKNSNAAGYADVVFVYGAANWGWTPIVGDWNGVTSNLTASEGAVAAAAAQTLTAAELSSIVDEAVARWMATDLDAVAMAKLEQVHFTIGDLSGSLLATAGTNQIVIDESAAGHGWFVDPTPATDEEFTVSADGSQLQAVDPQAVDRIDLLTVVEHELGHILGFDDLDALADSLMSGSLASGVRRQPTA